MRGNKNEKFLLDGTQEDSALLSNPDRYFELILAL